ncbi:MAG: response regulator [Polyangiales bacterium]
MQRRVLFVDDESEVLECFALALSDQNYEVRTASSGEEALALMERERIDVIICDERMPGLQGSEVLVQVRARHPETVRIILTGQATLQAAVRAINEGEIYRFLTKPCGIDELAVVINAALERHAAFLAATPEGESASERALRAMRHDTDDIETLPPEALGIRLDTDNVKIP